MLDLKMAVIIRFKSTLVHFREELVAFQNYSCRKCPLRVGQMRKQLL